MVTYRPVGVTVCVVKANFVTIIMAYVSPNMRRVTYVAGMDIVAEDWSVCMADVDRLSLFHKQVNRLPVYPCVQIVFR